MNYIRKISPIIEPKIKVEEVYVKEEPLENINEECMTLNTRHSRFQGDIKYEVLEELSLFKMQESSMKSDSDFIGLKMEEIYLLEAPLDTNSEVVSNQCETPLEIAVEDVVLAKEGITASQRSLLSANFRNHKYDIKILEKERRYTCAECSRTFSLKGNLSNHILSVHKKIKPHKCSLCENAFTQKCELTHHILSVHKNINPHQCSICDSTFSTKGNLSTHILSVHWKVKPHKCSLCENAFGTKQQLSLHNLSVHQKIKPHKCSMCRSAYVQKSHLSTHILSVHKKIKPHKCSMCDSAFSQKGLLSRHVQSVHQKLKSGK